MKKKVLILIGLAIAVFLIANLAGFILSRNEVAVSELTVGDCLSDFYEGDATRVVEPVVCSVDHVQEVVGVFDEAFDQDKVEAPSSSEAMAVAAEVCVPAFNDYSGLDYETADFQVLGIYPDEEAWAKGQRTIVCLASNSDQSLIEGTLGAAAI